MRFALIALGLLALGACTPGPLPPAQVSDASDLKKFVEPTNGAAYSQSNEYYYRDGSSTGYQGPSGDLIRVK